MSTLYRRTRTRLRPVRRGAGWLYRRARALLRPLRRGAGWLGNRLRRWIGWGVIKLRHWTGFNPNRPLVFLHIPKTSGIAFAHGLIDAVPPAGEFFGFDRASFGAFHDFASVSPEARALIHLTPDTIPRDRGFVRAHAAFSTLAASYGHGQFVTVLREPRSRILSHWLFWRGFSEEQMATWGGWAGRMRLARGSLAGFLADPDVACQVDNFSLRLLLWPNKNIPDGGFIDPAHDAALVAQATRRLRRFRFIDIVENPALEANLSKFLRRDFHHGRANETPPMPPALRGDFQAELREAGALLGARSRLDDALWRHVAAQRRVSVSARDQAVARNMARYSHLLKGD